MMVALSHDVHVAIDIASLVSLVPIVLAVADVVRRPAWQFTTGRKVMWAITLGFGWYFLWPLALVSSVLYLAVLRRRFPPVTAGPQPVPRTPPWPSQPSPLPVAPLPRDLPPAGWYPDPAGGLGRRWWDGRGWTDHVR